MAVPSTGWTWSGSAQFFLNGNLQERKFRDFHQVESQNWLMVTGGRSLGRTRLMLHGMFSAEPATIRDLGSAQVFQTGETFDGIALLDYQHPHDLFMALSARLDGPIGARTRWAFDAALVGEPALGPTAFMHRPSAEANPTAPLGHHTLDSTHITHGVVTAGVTHRALTVEASAFHGREPDEDRVDLELGALDSYAVRVSWRRAGWHVQASGGHIRQPDPTEFTDLTRYTASVDYTGQAVRALVAWGRNIEPSLGATGTRADAWLGEATWTPSPRDLFYTRAELVEKDILTLGGYDPPGFVHPHVLSRIGALTMGYERRLAAGRAGHLGAGGDITGYRVPRNLDDNYGQPWSAHVFLRYRFGR